MKEELRKLFEEIINDYEDSEQTVINDRGDSSDYAWLEERIQEYRDRFDKIIQKEESEVDFDNKKCSCGGKLELHQLMCNPPIDVYKCNKCNTTHKR